MSNLIKQELDFFINNRPTPVVFFRNFKYTSKTVGLSNWCSALNTSLAICKDDPELFELKRNYENDHYKKSINDYFRQSRPAYVLEKEKISVDEKLTKKTGKAIRNRIDDLLSEGTDDQAPSKKPRLKKSHQDDNSILMSADSKINQGSHSKILPFSSNSSPASSSSSADPSYREEDQYFNVKRERYRIGYSWKNIVDSIDFRNTSRNDWVFEGYNLSPEFRSFQESTITQVKKNPFLCYQNDVQKILCLSNIMLIERTKPSYISCTQAIWDRICQKSIPQRLPSVAYDVILHYSSMLNSFTPRSVIQDVWGNNFLKTAKLNDQEKDKFFEIQIIIRNFLLLSSKSASIDNEDTFVHETLHDLLNEVFRDTKFELVWANSESNASKSRCSSNKENSRGKKPDFKLVINANDEILFGEVKPPKSKNSSLLLKKDLVKLANFQAGSLDELIKKYGNRIGLVSFGIWVCGANIYIYEMDLNYDGIYKMSLISNVIAPTNQAQFVNLIPLLEAFYNIKDRVSNISEILTHTNIPDFMSRLTYGRKPTSSPEPVKIAIVGSQSSPLEKM